MRPSLWLRPTFQTLIVEAGLPRPRGNHINFDEVETTEDSRSDLHIMCDHLCMLEKNI